MFTFLKHAISNWKTTLAGAAYAAGNLSLNGVSIKAILLSAVIAYLGAAAKDGNVTGGTTKQ